MRVIARKERPHPGTQLRFTDINGHRFTCFATSARTGQLADLELRHRRRARCEDRICTAKDTGLRNLPLHGYAQNQIWCQIVALACELLAWMTVLALPGPARRWEPKRLRLRLFTAAGRIVRSRQRLRLRLAARWPWARQITTAITPAAGTGTRLTSKTRPLRLGKDNHAPWNLAHPARQRAASHGNSVKTAITRGLGPQTQDHERSRLMARQSCGWAEVADRPLSRRPNRISSSGRARSDRFMLDPRPWPVFTARCHTAVNCKLTGQPGIGPIGTAILRDRRYRLAMM
jgi:hypothetical protein